MVNPANDSFFVEVPLFEQFEGVAETANYRPVPDDWLLAAADIVGSTKAIAAGRYKAVNMAGASVISAVLNALGHDHHPFVFGGDGATIAIPSSGQAKVSEALSAVQTWVSEELDLDLRAALVPVSDIRAAGHDLRVARYRVSPDVSYAMFSGGGASWAKSQMKAGKYSIAPAQTGARPDLTGLSCRWNPIDARNGKIVSIIAMPGKLGPGPQFRELVASIVAISAEQSRGGHPIPENGPDVSVALGGIETEARAAAPKGQRLSRKLFIIGQMAFTVFLDKFNLTAGRFDPKLYRRKVAENSDFRKFDDGLKMTVDLDGEHLRRIENMLQKGEADEVCRYGLHTQNSALMTCLVPTPLSNDHMHFIDGADGGYAQAASMLAAKLGVIK